jgi:hypothetical protein
MKCDYDYFAPLIANEIAMKTVHNLTREKM